MNDSVLSRLCPAAVLWLAVCFATFAEPTRIAGDLTKVTFSRGGGLYVVGNDLLVPEGTRVVIPAGTVFLFEDFTGIKVDGALIAEGTAEKPVVFTSVYDYDYKPDSPHLPNPSDWNGILVSRKSSGVQMSHFKVRYSTFGIKTQKPSIVIEHGQFTKNSDYDVAINKDTRRVGDGEPFYYPGKGTEETVTRKPAPPIPPDKAGAGHTGSVTDDVVVEPRPDPAPDTTTRVRRRGRRLRIALTAAGIVSATVGTIFYAAASGGRDEMREQEAAFADGSRSYDERLEAGRRWDEENDSRRRRSVGGAVSLGAGCVLLGAAGITFLF